MEHSSDHLKVFDEAPKRLDAHDVKFIESMRQQGANLVNLFGTLSGAFNIANPLLTASLSEQISEELARRARDRQRAFFQPILPQIAAGIVTPMEVGPIKHDPFEKSTNGKGKKKEINAFQLVTLDSLRNAVKEEAGSFGAALTKEVEKQQVTQHIIAGAGSTSDKSRGQPFRPLSIAAPGGGILAGAGRQRYNGSGDRQRPP